MFVIAVYDTAVERNADVLRTFRRYLHWVQNSVFEGHMSEGQLRQLEAEIKRHIDPAYDQLRIYSIPDIRWVKTHHWGADRRFETDVI